MLFLMQRRKTKQKKQSAKSSKKSSSSRDKDTTVDMLAVQVTQRLDIWGAHLCTLTLIYQRRSDTVELY